MSKLFDATIRTLIILLGFSSFPGPAWTNTKNAATAKPEDLNQCAGTIQHYNFPPTDYKPIPANKKTKQGKQIYNQSQCFSCHSINDNGGTLGPALDGIGGHRGEQFLIARLLDPEAQMREFPEVFAGRPNIMPHPYLTRKEAGLVARFLLSLPSK
ncbi:MAG: cytochrome c [Candidatus Obscuribacterales bacterium]|nr:cytochrome c [Candidatus Obscuribacterales bacterium]